MDCIAFGDDLCKHQCDRGHPCSRYRNATWQPPHIHTHSHNTGVTQQCLRKNEKRTHHCHHWRKYDKTARFIIDIYFELSAASARMCNVNIFSQMHEYTMTPCALRVAVWLLQQRPKCDLMFYYTCQRFSFTSFILFWYFSLCHLWLHMKSINVIGGWQIQIDIIQKRIRYA